jgi:hypothetical protein
MYRSGKLRFNDAIIEVGIMIPATNPLAWPVKYLNPFKDENELSRNCLIVVYKSHNKVFFVDNNEAPTTRYCRVDIIRNEMSIPSSHPQVRRSRLRKAHLL